MDQAEGPQTVTQNKKRISDRIIINKQNEQKYGAYKLLKT